MIFFFFNISNYIHFFKSFELPWIWQGHVVLKCVGYKHYFLGVFLNDTPELPNQKTKQLFSCSWVKNPPSFPSNCAWCHLFNQVISVCDWNDPFSVLRATFLDCRSFKEPDASFTLSNEMKTWTACPCHQHGLFLCFALATGYAFSFDYFCFRVASFE